MTQTDSNNTKQMFRLKLWFIAALAFLWLFAAIVGVGAYV